jgi:predicted double-glycine peptidase
LPVPVIEQETNYSCGAAALTAVLKYWQVFSGTEKDLYEDLKTHPENGTHPKRIELVAKKFGLEAELKTNLQILDLRKILKEGYIAIVNIQAWSDGKTQSTPWSERWDDGHYVVLTGMDKKFIYFSDPTVGDAYAFMPIDEFLPRWHDYEIESEVGRVTEVIKRYYQMAILIRGSAPLRTEPKTKRLRRLN